MKTFYRVTEDHDEPGFPLVKAGTIVALGMFTDTKKDIKWDVLLLSNFDKQYEAVFDARGVCIKPGNYVRRIPKEKLQRIAASKIRKA